MQVAAKPFVSVNPRIHDAINIDVSDTFCQMCENDSNCVAIILDGPDIGTTRSIKQNEKFIEGNERKLIYFQNKSENYDEQGRNLNLKGHFFPVDLLNTSPVYIPYMSKLSCVMLDTTSFPLKSSKMLEKILWLKNERKDGSDIVIFFNEIVRTYPGKFKMIEKQSTTTGNFELWSLLKRYKVTGYEDRILSEGKNRVKTIAEKYGFNLSENTNLVFSDTLNNENFVRNDSNYKSMLYTADVNPENKTMMHYSVFKLIKEKTVVTEFVNDIPEELCIDEESVNFENPVFSFMLYCDHNVVIQIHDMLKRTLSQIKQDDLDKLSNINGKDILEVIDIFINIGMLIFYLTTLLII